MCFEDQCTIMTNTVPLKYLLLLERKGPLNSFPLFCTLLFRLTSSVSQDYHDLVSWIRLPIQLNTSQASTNYIALLMI